MRACSSSMPSAVACAPASGSIPSPDARSTTWSTAWTARPIAVPYRPLRHAGRSRSTGRWPAPVRRRRPPRTPASSTKRSSSSPSSSSPSCTSSPWASRAAGSGDALVEGSRSAMAARPVAETELGRRAVATNPRPLGPPSSEVWDGHRRDGPGDRGLVGLDLRPGGLLRLDPGQGGDVLRRRHPPGQQLSTGLGLVDHPVQRDDEMVPCPRAGHVEQADALGARRSARRWPGWRRTPPAATHRACATSAPRPPRRTPGPHGVPRPEGC